MDRQALFKDRVSNEPKPPKKQSNHLNPTYCDTPIPEKSKGEFEVFEEYEDGSLSLDSWIDYDTFCRCPSYFWSILHRSIFCGMWPICN